VSTPICHRTIGPFVALYGLQHEGKHFDYDPQSMPCLGSACALWVPYAGGVGRCADNLRGSPWPDAAAPAKAGGAS
jgi:hypothetical protein